MNIEQPLPDEVMKQVSVQVPKNADLENWFTYHAPTPDDIPKYKDVRKAGLKLAETIKENCPRGADTSAAIRKVREAVMTANAAIACCGKKA